MSFSRLLAWQPLRVAAFTSLVLLAACGKDEPQQGMAGMKIPVNVVTVQPEATELFSDLPGRIEAIKDAEVRARVNGIVLARNFEQGSLVEEGQLLYTIDPAPYKAARDQAAAELQRAQANAQSAVALAQRYDRLIKENAVSRQDYDTAKAGAAQAQAAIAAAKAALANADINLGYTKVVAPISGRIGKSLVTEGALVSANAATPLAVVQQLDKVYVDITRSTNEMSQLRRAAAQGKFVLAKEGQAKARIRLDDNSFYEPSGRVLFEGVSVDPSTAQVSLRAEFDNPEQILLPGMYVRVVLEQGVAQNALLVPAQAIQYGGDGLASVVVVREGKPINTAVTLGAEKDGRYIVQDGLQPGDQVLVAGFQKLMPGATLQPIPWDPNNPEAEPNTQAAPSQSGEPATQDAKTSE
ncbi:efflux RND transporter periplasmic adaptor subunit [Alcaligenes endophyticus]|uniref:Efflux RND transporter periplasmic adaptor subunit n=1 Tax=Alcaligenes endophyticus TaxID=1929088 RepID=A0ABT8EJD1_9BURK|nr:efflux RND transporter periplasmic adaptor subunit [Alcaligenes endophyticus]MCX5591668.1 efflux RND transporter periplasmic adaptor subunit [Alcaligenes endophyticus]MDN4121345.1 efflux RND transporter periplasmic adaptor subunit [Alcaligenes endophyticus]